MILQTGMVKNPSATRLPLRTIALPTEHGGWGFLFEPVLLAVLVAPSGAGGWLGLAALGAFLARHPLKITLNDTRRNKMYPRTRVAATFAVFYALIALTAFVLAVSSAASNRGAMFWWPLAPAVPFGLVQLYFDAHNRSRELHPEVLGSLAMAFLAPAIALAGGWPLEQAVPLWIILASRAVPSILYVRTRLRLERGEPMSRVPSLASHLMAVVVVGTLAVSRYAPWLALLASALLLARSVYGLSSLRLRVPAKVVGVQEIAYGLLLIVLTALGYGFRY